MNFDVGKWAKLEKSNVKIYFVIIAFENIIEQIHYEINN